MYQKTLKNYFGGKCLGTRNGDTIKTNILLKHLKPRNLSGRGEPLQTFNTQSIFYLKI